MWMVFPPRRLFNPFVKKIEFDIAVFGGGIAGLWTLARLLKGGYRAFLFESGLLGGVQSIAAQGIIHGGTKYALTGKLTGSSEAIRAMPVIWQACLQGHGELDLSDVKILSEHQYLWSTGGVSSALTGFFASKMMQSRMTKLESEVYPEAFAHPEFSGHLYRLEEPVLDVSSLIHSMVKKVRSACVAYDVDKLVLHPDTPGLFRIGETEFSAQRLLLTAGAGNELLLKKLGKAQPQMQRRPLQMVMVKGALPAIYGHCLATSPNPKLTVTTHRLNEKETAWYLGGQLAEEGVELSKSDQIAAAKQLVKETIPWLDVDGEWATLNIDRAEPLMEGGKRPDDVHLSQYDDVYTAWPTKLAFAPRLAQKVLDALEAEGVTPTANDPGNDTGFESPGVAELPWLRVDQWT